MVRSGVKQRTVRSIIVGVQLLAATLGFGQCLTTITTFPYTEGFEGGAAWTSGGTNSDWSWGSPTHPTINTAAEGDFAWCVGGLTGSFYSNGQQSWLETPCFDISALNYPWISFWIYWETEPGYDGAGLQYTTNGVTWINLGSTGDDDCLNTNWFNSPQITALNLASPKRGWSGTATSGGCANGGGSGSWVLASHCLDDIPTDDPVKFRFIFGAGSICNTFDGVAIDGVYIGEAPELTPIVNFTCAGNTLNFSNGATLCETSSVWNFGDPASGAANTAAGDAAAHTFSGPGTYTVSLSMTGPCTPPATVTRDVTIAELDITTTSVGCTGNSGTATAEITGSAGPFVYDWSPGNETTQTISDLGPGTYSVLVQSADMCALQGSVTLTSSGANVTAGVEHDDITCAGLADGTATVTAGGGSGTYSYAWTPTGGNSATASGLGPGDYTCTISDDAGCSTEVDVTISEPDPITLDLMADPTTCAGGSVTLSATAAGGTPDYTYNWSPAGPDVSPSVTATYTVTATDAGGCTSEPGEITLAVTPLVEPAFSWDVDAGCAPLCVTFTDETPAAGVRGWVFGDGTTAGDETAPQHCFTDAGSFDVTLTVTTADGCTGTFTAPQAISVLAQPVAGFTASPPVALVDDPTFHFVDRSIGATVWSWSFGDPATNVSTEPAPTFTYPSEGCYTVTLDVANEEGCSSSTTGEVCVEDAFALYAPNCFSPNGDGINDDFGVLTTVTAPDFFVLDIYDRWGAIIHTSDSQYKGWDGDGIPQGTYNWQVRLRDTQGKLQQRKGHVTLIR